MRLLIISLTFLVAYSTGASIFEPTLDKHWLNYKTVHGKNYGSEETVRRLIWEANLIFINKHNTEAEFGHHTFTLGMNKFGDMTSEEFANIYNGYNNKTTLKTSQNKDKLHKMSGLKNPESVDWRTKGYVTPIKDQAQCGSCWAFSAVASLEGQYFALTSVLPSLSEQNLVDCSASYGNHGCQGGSMDNAFEYIKNNGGIDRESTYPYTGLDGECKFNPLESGAWVSGHVDVEMYSEDALVDALATIGPISVAIDASQSSFQLYKSGVYDEPACSPYILDHGVTAVGYGTGPDGDFYIVKNSWGETWGQDGYVMMSRNKKNQCGIATEPSYPIAHTG